MINPAATDIAFWGIMLHLIADWLLQTEAMSKFKTDLRFHHAYLHAFVHFAVMTNVFHFEWAVLIAIIHLIIDTRIPLDLWRRLMQQTTEGEMAIHVAIWQDQVVHWLVICIAAIIVSG